MESIIRRIRGTSTPKSSISLLAGRGAFIIRESAVPRVTSSAKFTWPFARKAATSAPAVLMEGRIGKIGFLQCSNASILTPELIIKQALAAGKTDITLNLAADFRDFSKITDALKNAEAGTINLTLKGCEKIKDFNSVKSLKSINLPDIITIYDRAFQECTNLESVQAPEALKISNFAFTNCSRLESVYAPNLEIIERYTFDNCHNLRKVELGNIESAAISSFDGIETRNISLTLSADQMKMTQNFISWEPTSTNKYKDSQDHKDRKFCNFTFKSIKCGDSTY